jgi:aminopeptidase N
MTMLVGFLLLGGWLQGEDVAGVVTDQTGAPIPEASVVLAPVDHSRAAVSTRAGRDGGFHFDPQMAGSYTVCVEAQAFVRRCVDAAVAGGSSEAVKVALAIGTGSPVEVQGVDAVAANTGRVLTPGATGGAGAQKAQGSASPQMKTPTKDDLLRGAYGPYRANNDLLSYHLDVRVDPEKKTIAGKNTVRFRMLRDGRRIQLDLVPALAVDRVVMVDEGGKAVGGPLHYERDERAVFIDFYHKLKKGKSYGIDFFYSGEPVEGGRFGGMAFKTDPKGHAWINTACEEEGASVWWPNKDQWRDEPETMDISVAIPDGLVDVSNGRFVGKTELGDGYTRWDWHVSYPINNYDVALNIGNYVHFGETHRGLAMDYWVLPENLAKAKVQFAQAPAMIDAFEHYFGEYPFKRDGYKLIEVPYAGMEHQSAVAYGNHFANGYLDRDWTGVGISLRFDFIVIHESGHEWFGNAITAQDRADMWIHEGWTTYLECLYVEYMWGHEDEITYVDALKKKVRNVAPIIPARGVNAEPPQDMYFKGALFLNTLRSVVNDDAKWFAMIREFYQTYQYRTITTEDVVGFFSAQTGMRLGPVFDEYLRHAAIPVLELRAVTGGTEYRWRAEEAGFAMPVRVKGEMVRPTGAWQRMDGVVGVGDVDTKGFYVGVEME